MATSIETPLVTILTFYMYLGRLQSGANDNADDNATMVVMMEILKTCCVTGLAQLGRDALVQLHHETLAIQEHFLSQLS